MEQKEMYEKNAEKELDRMKTQIKELQSLTDKMGKEAKHTYKKEIEDLKRKHQSMRDNLKGIKASGENKWVEYALELENVSLEFKNISLSLETKLKETD